MANINSFSVEFVKEHFKITSFDVVENPNTGKLFVASSNGTNFKCQSSIDFTKSMNFIGESIDDICLVNKLESNIKFSF